MPKPANHVVFPIRDVDLAPNDWISRDRAATLLRCTYRSIIALENAGKLHAKYTKDGYVRVSPIEVEELTTTYKARVGRPKTIDRKKYSRAPGPLQGMIVSWIKAGRTPDQIVAGLNVTFEQVRNIQVEMRTEFTDGFYSVEDERRKAEAELEHDQKMAKIRLELEVLRERAEIEDIKRARAMVTGIGKHKISLTPEPKSKANGKSHDASE